MADTFATSLPLSNEAKSYLADWKRNNEKFLGNVRMDCNAGLATTPKNSEVCPAVLAETLKYAANPDSIPVTDARHPYFTALAVFRNTKGAESIRQLPPELQFELYVQNVARVAKNNSSQEGDMTVSMYTPKQNVISFKVPREAVFEAGYMSKVNELGCGNRPQYEVVLTDDRIQTVAKDNFKDDPFAASKTYTTTQGHDWDGGYALAKSDIRANKPAIPRRQECFFPGTRY